MNRESTFPISPRFIRFAVTGGVAAVVNILSRIALSMFINFSWSIIISYLAGMTTAFVLMKFFVFERSGRTAGGEYLRFALVNGVALLQVWAVSMFMARIVFPAVMPEIDPETPSHVIGVLSPVATSYFLHKYFTFGRRASPMEAVPRSGTHAAD